jgi:flavodoxin
MMTTGKRNKVLVSYFSYSGNTQKVAQQIQNLTDGDIFRIEPVNDYPASYQEVLDIAKKEIRSGEKPELKDMLYSLEQYDLIFIAYPNWRNTYPAPVATFLSAYNFNGKSIIPFCTHGGGGTGHSVSDIAKQCPGAEIMKEFSINGYAVGENNIEIEKWINNLKINEL